MRRAVLFSGLFVLALAAALIVVLVIATSGKPKLTSAVFANGSRLKLLGAARESDAFTTETRWQKLARRFLPRAAQRWIPETVSMPGGGDSNILKVFFTLVDTNGAILPNLPWQWFRATADDGSPYQVSCGGGPISAGRTLVDVIWLRAFPRRQKDFTLQFLDGHLKTLGSVRVPNPIHGPFAQWTPERLPITRTNGAVAVTLQSLAEVPTALPPNAFQVSPTWELETSDPLWRGAELVSQQWSDATGNHGSAPFSFSERAWKLEMAFRRSSPTNYHDSEKFLLPGLKPPAKGTLQMLSNEVTRLDVKFRVAWLIGPGAVHVTVGTNFDASLVASGLGPGASRGGRTRVETWNSAGPFFMVQVSGAGAFDDEIRFRVLGSRGEELPSERRRYNWSGVEWQRVGFDAPNGTSSVTLEGTVAHARVFEFLIDPAQVER